MPILNPSNCYVSFEKGLYLFVQQYYQHNKTEGLVRCPPTGVFSINQFVFFNY